MRQLTAINLTSDVTLGFAAGKVSTGNRMGLTAEINEDLKDGNTASRLGLDDSI